MGVGVIDIIVFVIFVVVVIGIGLWQSRGEEIHGEHGARDYFLAGRGLTWWLVGFSLIAANISTEQFVGMSGKAADFRIVGLDTGTVRPGLEKSTYRNRRAECDEFSELLGPEFGISCLADVRSRDVYDRILDAYIETHPDHCDRLTYIFHAQQRFATMPAAWKAGDVETVGRVFRKDGIGLRDEYKISGPELETMCDIARTVPGVLGERMLGGGDKGAAGALVRADSVGALESAIRTGYPRSHPAFADDYAVHVCKVVEGITTLDQVL